jgi:outer membrane lipoprotein carrier protein
MVPNVQNSGAAFAWSPWKSNSGNKEHIAYMTASVIANRRTAVGFASVWLLSGLAFAQDVDLKKTLKGVESRYNSTQTLESQFSETYLSKGHKRTENGTLYLKKPGKMRWEYTAPAGKLFVSDGQFFYFYNAEENRAEKTKLKEAEDLKAPLAFLLGRLNFNDDFREFRSSAKGEDVLITATPKSDKLPYSEVTFLTSPDFAIKHLEVKGQDGSTLQFDFSGEKKNPPVQESMFKFTLPVGAEMVDSTRGN